MTKPNRISFANTAIPCAILAAFAGSVSAAPDPASGASTAPARSQAGDRSGYAEPAYANRSGVAPFHVTAQPPSRPEQLANEGAQSRGGLDVRADDRHITDRDGITPTPVGSIARDADNLDETANRGGTPQDPAQLDSFGAWFSELLGGDDRNTEVSADERGYGRRAGEPETPVTR